MITVARLCSVCTVCRLSKWLLWHVYLVCVLFVGCPNDYGDTFTKTAEHYLNNFDENELTGVTLEFCKQTCIDTPGCRSFDYDNWWNMCRISFATKFGNEAEFNSDFDFDYHQRNCAWTDDVYFWHRWNETNDQRVCWFWEIRVFETWYFVHACLYVETLNHVCGPWVVVNIADCSDFKTSALTICVIQVSEYGMTMEWL